MAAELSRQRRYERRKLRAGMCPNCGTRPRHVNASGVRARECLYCLVRDRERAREAGEYRPWQPGRPGRPIKHI